MMNRFALRKAACALVLTVAALLRAGDALADVRLPRIFGDGMVLQRDMAVPVWGWAEAGESVTVEFGGHEKSATADAGGAWIVRLDAMPASASPQKMIVVGRNTVTFNDVLVGEVWLCGGQSNMQMVLRACLNFEAEAAAATNPAIRQIKVGRRRSGAPTEDLDESSTPWTACTPATADQFTAAGYFFAREIAKELDVPVGLINDNWGGTGIEPWIPVEGLRMESSEPYFRGLSRMADKWNPATEAGQEAYQQYLAQVRAWIPRAEMAVAARRIPPAAPMPPGPAWPPVFQNFREPTILFNGMIAPVIPYAIRGALWYQGEANGEEGAIYFHKMKALIGSWRQLWGEGDFPFYYVQLSAWQRSNPDKPAGGDGWTRLREAQLQGLAIPNTGMAVTIDIGDAGDIHPKDKEDVGRRLALWALAKTYGRKGLVFSGPLYKSQAIEGNEIRIAFDDADDGLIVGEKSGLEPVRQVRDGKLKWFAIAGKDKVWHWADAVIDSRQTVLVSSKEVPEPVAVRYAFTMNPEGANLYNKEGLPASPFRTDDW